MSFEKELQPKKVAVSIPNESYIHYIAYDNHLEVFARMGKLQEKWKNRTPRYDFGIFTVGRILPAFAREQLVKRALTDGVDLIIMMDNDMIYPPNFFEQIILASEEHPSADIIAPLCFMRNPPYPPVIYITTEGVDPHTHQRFFRNEICHSYPKDSVFEVDAVGFGAVLIKMELVKKMQEPYFMSTTGSGEDIYFCNKAKKVGARIFVDTRIKLGHLGNPVVITEDYKSDYDKKNKISHKEQLYLKYAKKPQND